MAALLDLAGQYDRTLNYVLILLGSCFRIFVLLK